MELLTFNSRLIGSMASFGREGYNLMRRRLFAVLVALSCSFNIHAQYARTLEPEIPQDWEATVIPPPKDEWLSNMPDRMASREPRSLSPYPVRVFYLIPSNRTAQPFAVERIRAAMINLRDFYSEQMDRNGFGAKTLSLETEADGITPMVHVFTGPNLDSYYRADPWARVPVAAQNAGLPVWSPEQVWLGVFEGHIMNPDGSIVGEFNGGASFGSGRDAGLGITNSNSLALARVDLITSTSAYDGIILPELGPYPMVYNVTAASFDGSELGELASVRFGVLFHELSHGLGLPHDFRNDRNFFGNLMGNGFRGFRSRMMVNHFPDNETRLSYGDALALNVSRYFNSGQTYTDNTKPSINAVSSSSLTIINGHMPIHFTATDASGLACATLQLDGNTVEELPLTGTSADATFSTAYYAKSGANSFIVSVFDTQGNKQQVSLTMTAASNVNKAPVPSFYLLKSTVNIGEAVYASLSGSADSDNTLSSLTVEWDWDGDGIFEIGPLPYSAVFFSTSYAAAGNRLIRVRLTDPAGAYTVSTPIAIHVIDLDSEIKNWGIY